MRDAQSAWCDWVDEAAENIERDKMIHEVNARFLKRLGDFPLQYISYSLNAENNNESGNPSDNIIYSITLAVTLKGVYENITLVIHPFEELGVLYKNGRYSTVEQFAQSIDSFSDEAKYVHQEFLSGTFRRFAQSFKTEILYYNS